MMLTWMDDVTDRAEMDQGFDRRAVLRSYGLAAAAVMAATLIGLPFRGLTDPDNLTMIYLTGVVLVSLRLGLWPAVFASILSVALFNFIFTPPYYSFSAFNPAAYLTFFIMLASSLVVAALASAIAGRLAASDRERAGTRLLLDLARDLAVASTLAEIRAALVRRLSGYFAAEIAIEPGSGRDAINEEFSGLTWRLPLAAGGQQRGAMTLRHDIPVKPTRQQMLELQTIAALVAGTLLRMDEAEETARLEAEHQSEHLRNVLLSSLSHDLRTPLTVLSGTVANLARMRRKLPREAMDEIADLTGQINRLQTFTGNLLRIAAISAGQLRLNREAYGIAEIIGAALARLEERRGNRHVRTITNGTIPLVDIDGAMVEQVVFNLIDNAINHTADDGTISISLARETDFVRVTISDDGRGLKAGDEELVFERFRTGQAQTADRKATGSHGLGLAICRGIVEAHGGVISADNDPGLKGARFSFTLPVFAADEGAEP